jgi:hypothetical protein
MSAKQRVIFILLFVPFSLYIIKLKSLGDFNKNDFTNKNDTKSSGSVTYQNLSSLRDQAILENVATQEMIQEVIDLAKDGRFLLVAVANYAHLEFVINWYTSLKIHLNNINKYLIYRS